MYESTKIITLGSCAFRQPKAKSHCRFLHGYNLKAKFWIQSLTLDKNGWVYDFGEFKELKKILRNTFDHTTIIRNDDPFIEMFRVLHEKEVIQLVLLSEIGIEAFAKFCLDSANKYFKESFHKVWCVKVEVFEHELNSAICTTNGAYEIQNQ